MLSRAHRLRRSTDFQHTVRRGTRASSGTVVVHAGPRRTEPAEVGFVVSRAVGNAVVRNRVKRRLRELSRERLGDLDGRQVVVRANPVAAEASYPQLRADFDRCLSTMTERR